MFIHWDPGSQRGWEVSWPMAGGVFSLPHCQSVTPDEYHALAQTFDPTGWDPAALAAQARACSMGYVVFTTRHHNGFAMFDSAHGGHGVREHLRGRDLFGELVEAFRGEGLRVGAYYSLSDWHHPDYPPLTEEHLPYLIGLSPPPPGEQQADRYRQYLADQITELLTNYGTIDVLWFDGQWERSPAWWDVDAVAALARRLQPDILINDRLPGHGDFDTPEQFVPPTPPEGRWESCVTINDSWGWNPDDDHHRSPHELIRTLCETAGRGGNLLLNVGPRGDGTLPPEQIDRLDAIAGWMDRHRDAIVGTSAGLEPWQFYGPSTRQGNLIHLLLVDPPVENITVRGIPIRRVQGATVMGTGRGLGFRTRTDVLNQLGYDPPGELTIDVPRSELDDLVTVVTVEVVDDPIDGRPVLARVSPPPV
jgi:alpha-L-fucosidase